MQVWEWDSTHKRASEPKISDKHTTCNSSSFPTPARVLVSTESKLARLSPTSRRRPLQVYIRYIRFNMSIVNEVYACLYIQSISLIKCIYSSLLSLFARLSFTYGS